jgi:hypothetical protein
MKFKLQSSQTNLTEDYGKFQQMLTTTSDNVTVVQRSAVIHIDGIIRRAIKDGKLKSCLEAQELRMKATRDKAKRQHEESRERKRRKLNGYRRDYDDSDNDEDGDNDS